ncbi:unnamed protein product [Diamesa hyperborea]
MNGTNSVTNDIKSSTKDSSTKDAVVEHVEEDDDDDIDVIEEIKIIRNKLTSTPTSSRNYQSDPKIRSSKQNLSISIEKYSANVAEEEVVESTEPLDEPMKSVKTESAHHTSTKATTATKKDTQERKSEDTNYQNLFDAPSTSKSSNFDSSKNVSTSIEQSSSSNNNSSCIKNNKFLENQLAELQRKGIALPDHLQLADGILDPDNDEDTWADCEEGSDTEEICTCRDYTDEDICSSEDELPSKDVDLSSYTQLDSMSDDILQDSSEKTTPKVQRKRKLTEQMINNSATESPSICMGGNRKRLALESVTTPRSNVLLTPNQSIATPKSASSAISERRLTPRLIPSKDNPAPELMEWLMLFNRWTNAERIWAIDRLIEHCEPTQVRHMMKVIEPQFQRDFISLLPKELALQVLSYLDPKDLLRAAQTCRSWRFLADDNLLWKDKCKHIGIISKSNTDKPKRGRTGTMPPISSPWKAAYMRHHTIEMNWRSNPVRSPKVLKGHDDHVITCLQFCGNRIVSGSDDNTLKVWSAVSGKCLRTLIGHTGGVWSSQMSGHSIISGSTDRTLKVWNAETGQCIHTLYGHTSTVRCMHLHGNKVVSGSRDATLRVWDIIEGSCLHILVGHLAAVRCVQYDGKLVVSGAYDYMVKVWNPERQECLHTLQGHTNRVYSLQFDGVHVVSGSLDTSIRVWEAETGSLKHTLMGHQSLTSGMELKNNILVSGNADSTVKVWDILSGQLLSTLSGRNKHHSAVTCLQFNTRFVITSSDDGTVKLWDVKTGEFIRNLVALDSGGSGGVVWRIRANDTKLICAVGSRNGTEETKLMVLDFDVIGACSKCSNIL